MLLYLEVSAIVGLHRSREGRPRVPLYGASISKKEGLAAGVRITTACPRCIHGSYMPFPNREHSMPFLHRQRTASGTARLTWNGSTKLARGQAAMTRLVKLDFH